MHRLPTTLASLLLVVLPYGTSASGVPSPFTSSVDPCLVLCPYGDLAFSVVVRDIANNPVVNSSVLLDCSSCPGLRLCPNQEVGTTVSSSPCYIQRVTNLTGTVVFHLHAGGLCPGSLIGIFADGIQLARRALASPDQNGSLFVNGTDLAIVQAKIGGGFDATADLDCDGALSNGDLVEAQRHTGHACDLVVPNLPQSWGRVKIRYR